MTSPKVAKWLIAGLLLINALLVALLVIGRPGGPVGPAGENGPRDIIVGELGFSDSQTARYDALIEVHRPAMRVLREEVQQLRGELYASLADPNAGTRSDSLATLIGERLADVERLNYAHLADVRALTTPEQGPAFAKLTERLTGLFAAAPQPNARK